MTIPDSLLGKIELKRRLHEFLQPLEDAILQQMLAESRLLPSGPPLEFHGRNLIAWGGGSESFTPSAYRLLWELWQASRDNRTLSKEDVRQDVLDDDEATDNAKTQRRIPFPPVFAHPKSTRLPTTP